MEEYSLELIRHEISVEEQNDIRSPEGDLKI